MLLSLKEEQVNVYFVISWLLTFRHFWGGGAWELGGGSCLSMARIPDASSVTNTSSLSLRCLHMCFPISSRSTVLNNLNELTRRVLIHLYSSLIDSELFRTIWTCKQVEHNSLLKINEVEKQHCGALSTSVWLCLHQSWERPLPWWLSTYICLISWLKLQTRSIHTHTLPLSKMLHPLVNVIIINKPQKQWNRQHW